MPIPSADHVIAALAVAQDIDNHIVETSGEPNVERDFAAGTLGPDVIVRARPVPKGYGDLESLEASFDHEQMYTRVAVPVFSCRQAKLPARMRTQRLIAASIVHELMHQMQYASARDSYLQAVALGRQLQAIRDTGSPTPIDWFDLYYNVPEELEAHAVQAAAEVYLTPSHGLTEAAFLTQLATTHVYTRILGRIAPPGHLALAGLPLWLATFESTAWQAYQSW